MESPAGKNASPAKEETLLHRLVTAFIAGLAFLAPVLLTILILAWLFDNLIAVIGPHSLIGQTLTAGGQLFVRDDLYGFWLGVLFVLLFITGIGWLVMTRARKFLEDKIDGWIGRIPFLGALYRPMAQMVRGMGGGKSEQMNNMSVCRIMFGGGIETIAFLASSETFDLGSGPVKLVLIPTAPVPVGGALLLVPAANVQSIPSMKFDDLAKLYLTMGMSPPAQIRSPVEVPARVMQPPGAAEG